jgi:hypothetical protein
MGKPIETLSKDELLDAIRELAKYNDYDGFHKIIDIRKRPGAPATWDKDK